MKNKSNKIKSENMRILAKKAEKAQIVFFSNAN